MDTSEVISEITMKMDEGRPIRMGLAVLAWLALACAAPAAETNTIEPAPPVRAAAQPGTNRDDAVPAASPAGLPRLQHRKGPELPPRHILTPAEQAQWQAHRGALRGMPPNRFWPGAPNTPATNGPSGLDPRRSRPSQYGITSHHAPPSVLKKYDRDKNGVLDPAEWYQYRKDLEKRQADRARLSRDTNSPPVAASTNAPAAKP